MKKNPSLVFHINIYSHWTYCWPPQIHPPQPELLATLPHVFHLRKDKFSPFQALAVTRKGNVLLKCLPNCQIHKLQITYYAKIWITPIMQGDRVHSRLPDSVLVMRRRSEGKLLPSFIRSGEHCAVWCIYRRGCHPRGSWHQWCTHCPCQDWSPNPLKISWEQPAAVPWPKHSFFGTFCCSRALKQHPG